MLINLKVKTLDAQTHDFSIDNEITVREFKDKIAEKTNISATQQRIIYCGRVLADDKKIKDFDVDGKVVHVAERPPPSLRGPSTSAGAAQDNEHERSGNRGLRSSPLFRALDSMVLGSVAIPVNAGPPVTAASFPANAFTPSTSFCMNRITVARHMLECANNIAAYLEDPSRGLNNTSLDILARGRWTMESTVVEVGITASELPQGRNIAEVVQGAVNAALRRNANTNVTVVQLPTTVFGEPNRRMRETEVEIEVVSDPNAQPPVAENDRNTATVIIDDVLDNANETSGNSRPNSRSNINVTFGPQSAEASGASTSTSNPENAGAANNSSQNSTPTVRRRTGTNVLAEVIRQMHTVQARLRPFVDQYHDMLATEPVFDENDTSSQEDAQRLFDRVSEALHYMSHAYHAISDLMLDMSQTTPRYLTCRPVLVEQSGYVSSNNYLSSAGGMRPNINQRPIEIVTAESNFPSAEDIADNNRSNVAAQTSSPVEDPIDEPVVPPNINAAAEGNDRDARQLQIARVLQSIVNYAGIDAQLHLQFSGPAVMSVDLPPPQNARPHDHVVLNNRNDIVAIVATDGTEMSDNGREDSSAASSNTSVSTTTTSPVTGSSVDANNQARVNTATLPTTSTQTRSTSRPQVQIGNGWNGRVIPANYMSAFDRFLPCNSHHIRESERASTTNNASNANNSENTVTSENRGTQVPPPPPVQIRDMANIITQRAMRNGSEIPVHQRRSSIVVRNTTRSAPLNAADIQHLMSHIASSARFSMRTVPATRNPSAETVSPSTEADPTSEPNDTPRSEVDPNPICIPVPSDPFEYATPDNGIDDEFMPSVETDTVPSEGDLRREFMEFLLNDFFTNGTICIATIPAAVDRALVWFMDKIKFITQDENPEYDSQASLRNILRSSLIIMVNTLFSDDLEDHDFEERIGAMFQLLITRLFNAIIICFGRSNFKVSWTKLLSFLKDQVEQHFERTGALLFLRRYIDPEIQPIEDLEDVEQFVVQRPKKEEQEVPIEPFVSPPGTFNVRPIEDNDVEMVELPETPSTEEFIQNNMVSIEDVGAEDNTEIVLPNVVVGSQNWHRKFPTEWIPVISHDMQSQNCTLSSAPSTSQSQTQSQIQSPYSDAYIDGMSVKRRKLVQATKPAPNIESFVSEGVRLALESVEPPPSSMTRSETPENIVNAIASQPLVQATCTQALRANVCERIKRDPDYSAEKFPQTAEFAEE